MIINDVKDIYNRYISQVQKLESERRPTDGLFGIGKKISDDPCHESFYDALSNILDGFEKKSNDSAEIAEVLSYICNTAAEYEEDENIYWMLCAAHGLTHRLAGKITAGDADKVLSRYNIEYPKYKRLPVQKQLVKILEKRIKSGM